LETPSESPRTKLVKGTAYSLIATVLVKLAYIINSIVVARLLGATQLGILALLGGVISVMSLFAACGIGGAAVKYIAEYEAKDRSKLAPLISTVMSLICVTAGISALILTFIASPVGNALYNEPQMVGMLIIASIPLFLNAFAQPFSAILTGFQKIRELSVRNIVATFLTVPAALALIFIWGLWGAVIAMVVSAFISLGVYIRIVGRILKERSIRMHFKIDRGEAKRLFHYALPLTLTGLVVSPISWLVLTILQQYSGFTAVGIYSVASGLSASLLLIPTAISTPMIPLISELETVDKERMQALSSKVLHMTFVFFLPVTMLLALFSPIAISILYGDAYLSASRVLYFLCIGTFLVAFDNVIVCVLMGTGRIWVGFMLNVTAMFTIVACTLILVPSMSEVGLGIASLISYVVYTIGVLTYARVKFGIKLHDIEIIMPIAAFGFVLGALPSFFIDSLPFYLAATFVLIIVVVATVVMLREYEWDFVRSILRKVAR